MNGAPIVGIAGVGLIGGSIGLRASAAGLVVHGWDPVGHHLAAARARGALAQTAGSFAALAEVADILVLAAPLETTLAQLAQLVAIPPRASLAIDVASVKVPVSAAGAELGVFVATHPIAGSERSGPQAARADLFEGRIWTYDAQAGADATRRARDFIALMGADPRPIDSAEHDRIVALTSHLPQLLSVVLGAQLGGRLDEPDVVALCGTGIRSMLRLGASSWAVWQAVLAANRFPVAQEVRTLAGVLLSAAEALETGKTDGLARDFAASAAAVARLGANAAAAGSVKKPNKVSDER